MMDSLRFSSENIFQGTKVLQKFYRPSRIDEKYDRLNVVKLRVPKSFKL